MRVVEGREGERHVLERRRRRNQVMEVRESEELMDVVYNYSFCMVQRQLYVSNLLKQDEILSYSKCYGPIES